nr:rho GDP-dissociation inhibitor 1-like [Ipomoea batatas]GMD06398.1 rho GDP-dissociation inhibitor 1-like [Ipomoea batatas]
MGGSDLEKKDGREVPADGEDDSDHGAKHTSDREASSYATEEDEELVQMGPKCSIREHLEMDKDDESLRRWKEQLLGIGSVEINPEAQEPDVNVLSLTIISAGRPDIVL